MNPDTRIAVCCYAGDAHQVVKMMQFYQHHECPITILSPEDSPVIIHGVCVDYRFGGKRCYIGPDCLARMREHLKILLTYPENHFLIHDADSFCLMPKLPDYLYAEPDDVLWSSLIADEIPRQQDFYPPGFPHISFQPPWFLSRKTIEMLLADEVAINPNMPLIDYWLVQLAIQTGLPYKGFKASISYPTADPFYHGAAWDAVRYRGTIFAHSVKTLEALDLLMTASKLYRRDNPDA